MAQWWEMSVHECDHDPDAFLVRQLAYYNTFYATEEGRQVMLDIEYMCYITEDNPAGTLAKINLFHNIRMNAGVNAESNKARIDAEANSLKLGE